MGIRIIDISGLSDESIISFGAMPSRPVAAKARAVKQKKAKDKAKRARERKKASAAKRKAKK